MEDRILRGVKPAGLPHSPWRLLEHLRIAQWDILQFCLDGQHVSPNFPEGYWPAGDGPPNGGAWDESIEAFRADSLALRWHAAIQADYAALTQESKSADAYGRLLVGGDRRSAGDLTPCPADLRAASDRE